MDNHREDEYELWDELQVRVQGVGRLTLTEGRALYREVLSSNVFLLACSGRAVLIADEEPRALEPFLMLHLRQNTRIEISASLSNLIC
jgi:hypothetical protein